MKALVGKWAHAVYDDGSFRTGQIIDVNNMGALVRHRDCQAYFVIQIIRATMTTYFDHEADLVAWMEAKELAERTRAPVLSLVPREPPWGHK
jgi:hypothetical protein